MAANSLPTAITVPPGEEATEKKRKYFDIDIYRDWCKSCGICAALCPKHCFTRDDTGGPLVVDPDSCIGCGWCEIHCPDFAISVHPRPTITFTSDNSEAD
ncbi:4Fe-4S dicluster domain-containing protein [Desulfobacca acetoxidans]